MKLSIITYTISLLIFCVNPLISCSSGVVNTTPITLNLGEFSSLNLPEIEPKYRNPWTKELDKKFQKRALEIINSYGAIKGYGNTYGENEKASYPKAMLNFLAGNEEQAIAFLQQEDSQAEEHEHTDGIDYYYCFTLKGQIRKYFLYGKFLDPDYKQRMFEAAKKWTQEDPLTRPHPVYGLGDGSGRDWDIRRRGRWVDGRNTDNLRAMRETSVYLMAEETGNEKTRLIYKEKIQRYVWALYHIGMGEWDSEVYHGHTFAPYLNLYDFAKDPEVKLLAKAALDWMSIAAAIKYYRGGWGGPVKRDYGVGNVAMTSSAARIFWLYFGDTPLSNDRPEKDSLFLITSSYRPPLAAVALAHKNFNKPLEILSSKPLYENWKPGNSDEPGYWETQFIGHSYQMGSLVAKFADGDVAPFKLISYNSQRGVDYFLANTGGKLVNPGKKPGDQIGQYRNLFIWLRPPSNSHVNFQIPKNVVADIEDNIWFFKLEKTWLAVHPINLKIYQEVKNNREIYSQEKFLTAARNKKNFYGFVLEVGEKETHGSYDQFQEKVRKNSQLNLEKLTGGIVNYRGSNQQTLQFIYNPVNLLPMIIRNGNLHQWSENVALYNSQTKDKSPIFLNYKEGKLQVQAGGYKFKTQVSNERKVVVNP